MARRKVTHSRKHNGRVIGLGNPDEWWSPRSVIDICVDIDTGLHRYYIVDVFGRIVPLRATEGRRGTQVGADTPSGEPVLIQLPDC